MRDYILFIDDSRYSVPTMDTLTVADDARARELALQRVASSKYHRQIEIWRDDRLLETIANPHLTSGG
ncbi:MAG: hypothetical protein ACYC8V_13910 [Caulobacteraceae bacterium]